jgi:hypothetical protein
MAVSFSESEQAWEETSSVVSNAVEAETQCLRAVSFQNEVLTHAGNDAAHARSAAFVDPLAER